MRALLVMLVCVSLLLSSSDGALDEITLDASASSTISSGGVSEANMEKGVPAGVCFAHVLPANVPVVLVPVHSHLRTLKACGEMLRLPIAMF